MLKNKSVRKFSLYSKIFLFCFSLEFSSGRLCFVGNISFSYIQCDFDNLYYLQVIQEPHILKLRLKVKEHVLIFGELKRDFGMFPAVLYSKFTTFYIYGLTSS